MKNVEKSVVYRDHISNHLVEIIDRGSERSLYFGGHVLQSTISLSAPESLALSYTRFMMAPLLFNDDPARVLVVGLGAGSLLHFLVHHFPLCRIEAIDNSAGVIELARKYFLLPDTPEISVHHRDGYSYLADRPEDGQGFDMILLDAFNTGGMAKSIYRADFFELCRSHLHQNGTICMNMWSGDRNRLEEVKEDVAATFTDVAVVPVPKRGNIICIGRKKRSIWKTLKKKSGQTGEMQNRFNINFDTIISCCIKNNLSFRQRLSYFFSSSETYQS